MAFLPFLDRSGIDIEARLQEERILDMAEIESVANACKLHVSELVPSNSRSVSSKFDQGISLERLRKHQSATVPKTIDGHSAANRMPGITDYLSWLVKTKLLRPSAGSSSFQTLEAALQIVAFHAGFARSVIGNGECQ